MADGTPPVELPEDKAEILKQFKEHLSDVLKPDHDDYFLMRWLRARSWNIKKAETMLRESLAWREEIGADTILETFTPPEVLNKYIPWGHVGYGRHGHPVWIAYFRPPPNSFDMKGILYSVRLPDFIKYQIYIREKMVALCKESSKKLNTNIEASIFIHDMEGFTLSMLFAQARHTMSKSIAMIEANYPETMKALFVINAPRVFPIMFNIVKPFLSEDNKRRIKILGRNWKEELLEHIEADQLPVHWGGTMTGPDGDEFASDKVRLGGTVPTSYYLKDQISEEVRAKMTTVTVHRASSLQLEYEIKQANTCISWTFETETHDIGFGLFKRTDSSGHQKAKDMKCLIPSNRYDCHIIPEEGQYTCTEKGTYVIRFDNTYSWMTAKKLTYFIELLEPDLDSDMLPPSDNP